MQDIIKHITDKYAPLCVLVYGSYADGTNNNYSDFDCIIIVENKSTYHDTSFVNGVQLDLFIHTLDEISNINCADFVQLYDALIIKDFNDTAIQLKNMVNDYVLSNSVKTTHEKEYLKSWLVKMLNRTERNDTEGLYRYHWALTDSLEIYFNLRDKFYFGPKKSIKNLMDTDMRAYNLYDNALRMMDYKFFKDWINYVIMKDIHPPKKGVAE